VNQAERYQPDHTRVALLGEEQTHAVVETDPLIPVTDDQISYDPYDPGDDYYAGGDNDARSDAAVDHDGVSGPTTPTPTPAIHRSDQGIQSYTAGPSNSVEVPQPDIPIESASALTTTQRGPPTETNLGIGSTPGQATMGDRRRHSKSVKATLKDKDNSSSPVGSSSSETPAYVPDSIVEPSGSADSPRSTHQVLLDLLHTASSGGSSSSCSMGRIAIWPEVMSSHDLRRTWPSLLKSRSHDVDQVRRKVTDMLTSYR